MNKKRSVLPYGDSTLSPPIKSTESEVAVWKEMQKDERYWNPAKRDNNFVKQVNEGYKKLYG